MTDYNPIYRIDYIAATPTKYETTPAVEIRSSGVQGGGASAIAILKTQGNVKQINLINPGNGYDQNVPPAVYISGGDPVNTNVLNAAGFGSDSSFGFSVGYIDSGTGMSLTADFFETMPIYGFNAMIIPAYATSDTLGTLDLDAYTGFSPEGKGVFNILTDIGDLGGIITEVNIVPVSAVPVPGAVWLFGSGLIGLIGVARRKQS